MKELSTAELCESKSSSIKLVSRAKRPKRQISDLFQVIKGAPKIVNAYVVSNAIQCKVTNQCIFFNRIEAAAWD